MTAYWKARLGVLLIFVLGSLAGGLASSAYFSHRSAVFFQRGAVAYIDILERRLTRNLSLDPDQKEQIHAYLMENLAQRKVLQLQIRPQVRMLNQQTLQQIKSILRSDQVAGFQQNLTALHRFAAVASLPTAVSSNTAPAPVESPGL